MEIVFFGSPPIALHSLKKILQAGHSVKLVITQPDRPSGRGKRIKAPPVKEFAITHGIPTYQPLRIRKDPEAAVRIKKINPDLNVVVAYGQIIPASIIYVPRFNSINVHFSLLPKYRGASPVQWALLEGETKTGVTIFELNEKMDEGDILSQEEVGILPEETAGELEARLALKGAELLLETIDNIGKIKPVKQDHALATYAPKIKKEKGKIIWEKDALHLERRVRAFSPWPSAFAFYGEKRIKILKGRKMSFLASSSSSPGDILGIKKEGIEVCCGGGSVLLIEFLQPENKKPMSAYAYSLGAKLREGEIFT